MLKSIINEKGHSHDSKMGMVECRRNPYRGQKIIRVVAEVTFKLKIDHLVVFIIMEMVIAPWQTFGFISVFPQLRGTTSTDNTSNLCKGETTWKNRTREIS